jgi:hypothetical protein
VQLDPVWRSWCGGAFGSTLFHCWSLACHSVPLILDSIDSIDCRVTRASNPAAALLLTSCGGIYWPLVFLFSGYLIAKQLAILKILNNLKHATDRIQMPSSPQVASDETVKHTRNTSIFPKFESYFL